MQILYISALSSKKIIDEIYLKTKRDPGFAVQKFTRLMVDGFIANNASVIALSVPPISGTMDSDIFINLKDDEENGVKYKYIPFINFPILKHICVVLYTFVYVLFWGLKNRATKCIICDVLNVSASSGALLASKINRVTSLGVVTDIFNLMVNNNNNLTKKIIYKLANIIHDIYITSFNKYVILTQQMNEVVNPKGKPYIVVEGICDVQILNSCDNKDIEKDIPCTVLYAGGLYEKYGLKKLVDAFLLANIPNAKLVIYGDGPYVSQLKEISDRALNVEYRGVKPNSEVVQAELRATILVNPRPTSEEFTKYSFPSKNMEYMATGTPVLTTRLPGMPVDYYPYVYIIDEESLDGYASALKQTMMLSQDDLMHYGKKAKDFVLKEKNNKKQTERILKLIKR